MELKMESKMQRKHWNLSEFHKKIPHLPKLICKDPISESVFEFKAIRVLDMPIYMPDQGWRIPEQLKQFKDVIDLTESNEGLYGYKDTHYVYITVDQKIVQAGSTGRRKGLHTDAYGGEIGEEVTHTYILSDVMPTKFYTDNFPISSLDCQKSLEEFKLYANNPVYYPCKQVLLLDPYVVHESPYTTEDTKRTFVKISYSRKKYNRGGNTMNELFDYDWAFVSRDANRRNDPSIET